MIGAIIQARTGSTRLPDKMILPFFENKTLLRLLIEKLLKSNLKIPIVLATTTNPKDDILVESVKDYPIKIFRGSEDDVLLRFIEAAQANKINTIIRICADNPFLQPETIKNLIEQYETLNCDYIGYILANNKQSIKTHFGFWSELTTLNALERIYLLTNDKIYHEHVTNYIYETPQIFDIHYIKAPEIVFNRNDIRLTIDTINDFEMSREIFLCLKQEESNFTIQEIVTFLDKQPQFLDKMKLQIIFNSK